MSLIGENGKEYGDGNIVVEEALRVTYSKQTVSGSWGYVSGNMSGAYSWMNEFHRYATKSFRYIGMTFAAAKDCRNDMIDKFTRTIYSSIWDSETLGGGWVDTKMGEILMAEITLVHDEGDAWSVHVRVNEDDVRYRLVADSTLAPASSFFSREHGRVYGSNGEGAEDEKEYVKPLVTGV